LLNDSLVVYHAYLAATITALSPPNTVKQKLTPGLLGSVSSTNTLMSGKNPFTLNLCWDEDDRLQ